MGVQLHVELRDLHGTNATYREEPNVYWAPDEFLGDWAPFTNTVTVVSIPDLGREYQSYVHGALVVDCKTINQDLLAWLDENNVPYVRS